MSVAGRRENLRISYCGKVDVPLESLDGVLVVGTQHILHGRGQVCGVDTEVPGHGGS